MGQRYRKTIEQFYCRGCGCLFDKNVKVYRDKVKCNQCAFVDMAPRLLGSEIHRSGCACSTAAAILGSITIALFVWQNAFERDPLFSGGTGFFFFLAVFTVLATGISYFVGKLVGYIRYRKNY